MYRRCRCHIVGEKTGNCCLVRQGKMLCCLCHMVDATNKTSQKVQRAIRSCIALFNPTIVDRSYFQGGKRCSAAPQASELTPGAGGVAIDCSHRLLPEIP
eukprot:s3931_g7.t1